MRSVCVFHALFQNFNVIIALIAALTVHVNGDRDDRDRRTRGVTQHQQLQRQVWWQHQHQRHGQPLAWMGVHPRLAHQGEQCLTVLLPHAHQALAAWLVTLQSGCVCGCVEDATRNRKGYHRCQSTLG